ncbi:unnamed protein product [Coregonus sp. 'balchen']|nr:unnamed protein product [Coregonus sp. 'balchen']
MKPTAKSQENHGMSIVFIGDTPSHHCLIPANANITDEWRNHSIPLEEESGTVVLSKCTRYKLDVIKSFSEKGYVPGIDVNVSEIQHETCLDGWEYDQGTYISTIVSEGRVQEAEAILRDAARRNRVTAPEVIFRPVQIEPKAGKLVAHNICDLVRSSNIRWVSITLWLVW